MKTWYQPEALTQVQGGMVAFPTLAAATMAVPIAGAVLAASTLIGLAGMTLYQYTDRLDAD
jgi:hypothetical protein